MWPTSPLESEQLPKTIWTPARRSPPGPHPSSVPLQWSLAMKNNKETYSASTSRHKERMELEQARRWPARPGRRPQRTRREEETWASQPGLKTGTEHQLPKRTRKGWRDGGGNTQTLKKSNVLDISQVRGNHFLGSIADIGLSTTDCCRSPYRQPAVDHEKLWSHHESWYHRWSGIPKCHSPLRPWKSPNDFREVAITKVGPCPDNFARAFSFSLWYLFVF